MKDEVYCIEIAEESSIFNFVSVDVINPSAINNERL